MFYKISERDIEEVSILDSCKKLFFPKNKGEVEFQNIKINEHIKLSKSKYSLKDDLCIMHDLYDPNTLCLNILLSGEILIDEKISKEEKHLKAGFSSIHIARQMQGNGLLKRNQKTNLLTLSIDNNYINEYLPTLKDTSFTKTLKYTNTSLKADILSKEIYNLNPNSKMQMLYLQSKVLELIYYEFLPFDQKREKDHVTFSHYDKNALKKARDIILSNLQNPPSTKELSKMVHLNEFKLKYGFKKFYGTSIYQSILTCKMNNAKKMLEDEEFNVSEVAKICGYNHISSFSQAFKKEFGINPKNIAKKKLNFFISHIQINKK